ncbi:HAD family hydrolase [Sphingopyxis sp. J-6]|uniref:HAD family hydrolase n=1 Tax=Sphingopyxis sp. J-6 TaxID=3122054 RepID=UPI0039844DA9
MAAEALIFDLDGTIWDSASWFARGLEETVAASPQDVRDRLVGSGNIIAEINRAGISRSKLLNSAFAVAGPPPLFDGIGEALDELKVRRVPLAVATNLPGTLVTPMLEMTGLNAHFSSVVHAGVCRTPKPHPRSILLTLGELGISPSLDVVYIGDRNSDAEAAARAGVSMAWVTHGYEPVSVRAGVRAISAQEISDL